MTGTKTADQLGKDFSTMWYAHESVMPDQYQDLVNALEARRVGKDYQPDHRINRAVIACEWVMNNVPAGGKVLDMACGTGFIAAALAHFGFDATGFDVSEKGIERARELATAIGRSPDMFAVDDLGFLDKQPEASYDCVLAIGLYRYLDEESRDRCYRGVHRVLKDGCRFLCVHQNLLFEMFALNDGTLGFWSDLIDGYSDAHTLLGGQSVKERLETDITVPVRKFDAHSVSRTMAVHAENPLTFDRLVRDYGYQLDDMLFPIDHVLPPFVERTLDAEALSAFKRGLELVRPGDWRSMFMHYEFLAFLEKLPAPAS